MTTYPVRPYRTAMPVCDGPIEDGLMPELRAMAVEEWHASCIAAGGSPLEEPTVREEPNLRYGWAVTDEAGDPVLTEDGEPVVDRVKVYVMVTGRAAVVNGSAPND